MYRDRTIGNSINIVVVKIVFLDTNEVQDFNVLNSKLLHLSHHVKTCRI